MSKQQGVTDVIGALRNKTNASTMIALTSI
jgi:hypothetical protein